MVTKWPSDTGPIEIRLPDGRTGYVRQEDVRTATDYHLTVEKRGGVWRITGFPSGD